MAIDVDPMTVSRFERGVTTPSLGTLHRIADAFGIPLARLLEDAPQKSERNGAEALYVLMDGLSVAEKAFVVDTVKRFCALKKRCRSD